MTATRLHLLLDMQAPPAALLCLMCTFGLVQGAPAQSAPPARNLLGLSLGLSDYHNRDLMLSPLRYRGDHASIELSYLHEGDRGFHVAEIFVAAGDVNSAVPQHVQTGVRAYIGYGYARQVAILTLANRALRVFVGGHLQSFADVAFPQDYDSGTWMVSHSLNLTGEAMYALDARQSLRFEMRLPVVSYVVRPPYAGLDERITEDQDTTWRSSRKGVSWRPSTSTRCWSPVSPTRARCRAASNCGRDTASRINSSDAPET